MSNNWGVWKELGDACFCFVFRSHAMLSGMLVAESRQIEHKFPTAKLILLEIAEYVHITYMKITPQIEARMLMS